MPHHLPQTFLRLPPLPIRRQMVGSHLSSSARSSSRSYRARLWHLLGRHESQPVELLLACGLAAYGGWIALPGFDSLLTGSSYSVLRTVASEATIGGILCTLGVGHVTVVLRGRLWPRVLAAWLATVIWLFLAAFLAFGSGGASAGASLFTVLAAFGAWSYWRLRARQQSWGTGDGWQWKHSHKSS